MSVLRPLLSRRGRLALLAVSLLLIGALVAAPSVSGAAPPNAVKQFTATISPTTAAAGVPVPPPGVRVTITNCGGAGFPDERCTLASTIGLGSIRIFVPQEFRPIGTPVPSSPNWTASYNPATGNIIANVKAGSNKLQPGQFVDITFSSTPTTCPTAGDKEFTTAAWGSTTISGSDPFVIQGAQPVISLAGNESCVTSGGTVTGPNGQTETITGNFQGHVSVTFGGNLDCSFDSQFGSQWSQFNLPTQVNIVPAADFVPGSNPKISTSRFPTEGADSSLYLICYGVPTADHGTFVTRGGVNATAKDLDGDGTNDTWVGILPNCYNPTTEPPSINPPPCVSEQFLDVTTNPDQIVISVRMPPTDPYKR
jgi:hypothetical protein